MERSVTYTEEVEREESLVVCDECQREVDEGGMEYHPPNYATQGGPTLHFCSDCISNMTDREVVPEHVQRAEEWRESTVPESRGTLRNDIKAIRLLSFTSLGLTLGGLFILISTLPAWVGFAALCFSALATGFSLIGINVVLSADEPKRLYQ